MSKVYDILIVGGGPAGYTAALYGARSGFSTAVLEKLSPGGQMATTSDVKTILVFPVWWTASNWENGCRKGLKRPARKQSTPM